MPTAEIETEERQVFRTVSVLRVTFEPEEVHQILLRHTLEHELPKQGLENQPQISTKVEASVDYQGEAVDEYVVEVVFGEVV